MIVPLQPFKLKCEKCGYTKIVKDKKSLSDPLSLFCICKKCNTEMQRVELDFFSSLFVQISK